MPTWPSSRAQSSRRNVASCWLPRPSTAPKRSDPKNNLGRGFCGISPPAMRLRLPRLGGPVFAQVVDDVLAGIERVVGEWLFEEDRQAARGDRRLPLREREVVKRQHDVVRGIPAAIRPLEHLPIETGDVVVILDQNVSPGDAGGLLQEGGRIVGVMEHVDEQRAVERVVVEW